MKLQQKIIAGFLAAVMGLAIVGTGMAQEIPTRKFGLRDPEGKRPIIWVGGGDFHDTARYFAGHRFFLETTEKMPVFITYSEEPSVFTRLDGYDAIIMSQQLRAITNVEEDAILRTVRNGKKVVAMHAATAAFRRSDPVRERFHAMLGGRFVKHPKAQEFDVQVKDSSHPIMQGIKNFSVFDEFYTFEVPTNDRRILLSGMLEGKELPLAWVRPEGKGEVFYIALGHGNEANRNPMYRQILKNAVEWALK
jgi:uncharacterized protein